MVPSFFTRAFVGFRPLSRISARAFGVALSFTAMATLSGRAVADSISITNPDFTTDASGWSVSHSYGNAGAYDATSNPEGSSSLNPYSVGGGNTGLMGYPQGVTTAGQFTNDAYDIANPNGPTPPPNPHGANISATARDATGALNWGTYRISSANGDLGSFYQDTGVQFAPNTTYTLTAYASGNAGQTGLEADGSPTPFSNTGVGLSGNSPLTMSGISANSDAFNNWGYSPNGALVERTISVDTADYPALVGQDIIVNLLADTIATGGGTSQYFTGAALSSAVDAPEPASIACLMLGIIPLTMRHRRDPSA
jgi:hypothetical protein